MFLLLSIGSVSILYIFNNSIFLGDDLFFHKGRIDGLSEAFKQGNYFPKINYSYLSGFGYATGIFYSDFFLVIPALLRVIGLSLSQVYIIFMVLITFTTFLVSYLVRYSFDRVKNKSILFSILYTFSTYRIAAMTRRGALGESLAFIFLPLVLLGIYHIIFKDSKKWYLLALGMTCLVLSHLITALIAIVFIGCLSIINGKVLYKERRRFYDLIKATVATIGLTLFYFVPIGEQLIFQQLRVRNAPVFNLSEEGLSLIEFISNTLTNNPYEVTIGLMPALFIVFYIAKFSKLSNFTKQLVSMSLIFWLFSLTLLSIDILDKTVLNNIQFPWRFYSLVTLLITFVISMDDLEFLTKKRINILNVLTIGIVLVTNIFLLFATNRYIPYEDFNELYNTEIGYGEEYLPTNTSNEILSTALTYDDFPIYNSNSGTGKITNYKESYGTISFDYDIKKPTQVTLPFIYYKGYKASVNDQVLTVKKSDAISGLTSLTLGGKGHVKVMYQNTRLQVFSMYVSILVLFILVLNLLLRNKFRKVDPLSEKVI